MAVAPTYPWVLLFRLVQGLVSKVGWLIGYILSKMLGLQRGSSGSALPACRRVGRWQAGGGWQAGGEMAGTWTRLPGGVQRCVFSASRIPKLLSIRSVCIPLVESTMASAARANIAPSRFLRNSSGICVFCPLR